MSGGFYQSQQWISLRRSTVKRWKAYGLPCSYCGDEIDWSKRYSAIADHIKPIRRYPTLALEPTNIVMMHHACHTKKTAWVDNPTKPEINSSGFAVGSEWE